MPLEGTYEPSSDPAAAWAREQAELYEGSGGTKGTTLHGRPVVLVTSIGARSGRLRKTPVMRVEHEGEYAVIASKGGAPNHPAWYHNLVAHPQVELQDGADRHDYIAREVSDPERARWWARAVDAFPPYASYQEKTDRLIPVFVLTRMSD
ncbi:MULTISPECIES: nitroreductase family deazaflavin-dependent oxidoreductase [unclassified Pseudactinotalea]|uniref:nitroreductase family deazaflavin-dependent oxidoreductase n=1 Tax=unclassified Pseudactinotalea TaxID=2649176 RepID=UPI00128E077F|nr:MULTISPECIES: nitroreductase family deazaflavin-dependent oxidoreductase [unclassified Pseudactinotalea]MPV48459.1 nitroreductase family deazaflavin-dependent oxidoreductase [Pseudactinotalea sp. HY160]QGH68437.1 nitroreductase family deazaflavin-dependent oxidoreductase [Pseudactinotalea sp. HY158]